MVYDVLGTIRDGGLGKGMNSGGLRILAYSAHRVTSALY